MNHQKPEPSAEEAEGRPVFIHLHNHSEYSLFDGTIRIKELVQEAADRGHTHVAITDHGNMHGAVELYLAAKSAGLTPVIGCEIYCEGGEKSREWADEYSEDPKQSGFFHLVLLAKNTEGYKNLLKIVSSGYVGEHLKDVPVVSSDELLKHGDHLIALSACMRGELGFLTRGLRRTSQSQGLSIEEALAKDSLLAEALSDHCELMVNAFGQGNYYVELIDNNIPAQKRVLPDLIQMAKYLNLPLIASADAHYIKPDFATTHALAIAIKNGITLNDIRERQQDACFHLRTDAEMEALFGQWPEALSNTLKVAEECSHVEIKMDTYYLPKIDLGTGESPTEALMRISKEGLEERFELFKRIYGDSFTEERKKIYHDRLDHELKVIIQMGFPDYFLIVQDFIGWAKKNHIPVGPGRGSGAGSLVAYALKITDLDPIPYNLIFERFLNPERVSMPDFDIDFCQWRREEVIQYCVRKYGEKNVAQITTFGKMQAKGAVKSVGRAMNLGYTRVDQFTKLFPPDLGITLTDALKAEPRLSEEMEKDESLKECMNYALQLEGLASHTSVHAAGLVISDGEMTGYVPVYTTDGKSYITQYEMKPTEKVGLVKFDFLGLKTLTVIDKAVELVRNRLDPKLNISDIPMDDEKVFKLLSAGLTVGVFQCESAGMTQLIMKLKPSTFEDVIALVALFRPGPLGSGMVDDFVERKHGRQQIDYPHPSLEPILKDTYGMILYQEQVQKIAAVLAKYSLGEADLLRRAMGKKIPEEMAKQKTRFVEGAVENQIDRKLAEDIFELMAEFAKYGFNKSHSGAYGLVSYQTAWLKAHYPEEFLAASMTCDMDNTEKIVRYAEDCVHMGFTILPPDINRSLATFDVPENGKVGFALAAIKGVGEAVLEPLIAERQENGPYTSLVDLAQRVNLGKTGKKTLQLLTAAGALDCFGFRRQELDKVIPALYEFSIQHHEASSAGQRSLFSMDNSESETQENVNGAPWEDQLKPARRPWEMEDLFSEKKLLGFFLSGHPLDFYKVDVQAFGGSVKSLKEKAGPPPAEKSFSRGGGPKVGIVALLTGVSFRRTKKGTLMAYVRLEENGQAIEAIMFEKQLEGIHFPETDTPVAVWGHAEMSENGQVRFTLESVRSLDELRQDRVRAMGLEFHGQKQDLPAEEFTSRFAEIVKKYPGPCPVRLSVGFDDCLSTLRGTNCQVELSSELFRDVDELTNGEHTIKYALH